MTQQAQDAADQEARKQYEVAWREYDDAIAALRKAHGDAINLAHRRFAEMKRDADRAYGEGSRRAWQKLSERTEQAAP